MTHYHHPHYHQPRKRFGQHFLNDQSVIERIVAALLPKPDEHWVEIGPGQGALTQALLPRIKQLQVIELDRDLIPLLQQNCANLGSLEIFQGDALTFNFSQLKTDERKLRITGNLPYNISTPLLFHLLDHEKVIQDMHFMLQKEVVERMAAPPDSEHYGRLSVMVQYHCQVKSLFKVGRQAFTPPPKVESAVVRLVPWEALPFIAKDYSRFYDIVKQAFSQRRKMLRNSLKSYCSSEQLLAVGVSPDRRPEELTVEDFVKISNNVAPV